MRPIQGIFRLRKFLARAFYVAAGRKRPQRSKYWDVASRRL